jgi:beta-glucanase (GH16 family)
MNATSTPAGGDPTAGTPTPGAASGTADHAASPAPPAGWTLAWADEFDGPAGAPPDRTRWSYALGDGTANGIPGWGNGELETYTDDPQNAAMDGAGNLVISAIEADGTSDCYYGACRYTSARLLTADTYAFAYGRIEARLRVAPGHGLWSALWMLGSDIATVGWPASGEIDIMENVGRQPERLYGTLHGPGYSGDAGFGSTIDLALPLADAFHVYAVEWEPGHIVWTVDGERYHEATPADVAPNAWVYDHEFYLLINLAVGGGLGGPVGADTAFPARYLLDYIRVYRAS